MKMRTKFGYPSETSGLCIGKSLHTNAKESPLRGVSCSSDPIDTERKDSLASSKPENSQKVCCGNLCGLFQSWRREESCALGGEYSTRTCLWSVMSLLIPKSIMYNPKIIENISFFFLSETSKNKSN